MNSQVLHVLKILVVHQLKITNLMGTECFSEVMKKFGHERGGGCSTSCMH